MIITGSWNEKSNNCEISVHDDYRYEEMILESSNNSLIFIHNHPNKSNLSMNDILNLITTESLLGVIAVSNSGNIYFAFKNCSVNYTKLYRTILNKIYNNIDLSDRLKSYNVIYNKILNNPEKFGLVIGKSVGR